MTSALSLIWLASNSTKNILQLIIAHRLPCYVNVIVQVRLKNEYKVRLFIDESVSFGTVGACGRGVTEHFEISVSKMTQGSSGSSMLILANNAILFHDVTAR